MLPRVIASRETLLYDLDAIGVQPGDGLFVHASLRSIGHVVGHVVGGPRIVVEALIRAVGPNGLLAMPAFSTDAVFPAALDVPDLPLASADAIEAAVPGHDPAHSSCVEMGAIAETFRTWQGTIRSGHPCVSVCLRGPGAETLAEPHSLAWATGPDTPLGRLRRRPATKILLIGVDWTRCSALHTAETLAVPKRIKRRHFKLIDGGGAVRQGRIGTARARLCDLAALVAFASRHIAAANRTSGDRA